MGAVYRAIDRYSGQVVALKLLHESSGTSESERFVREAQLLSELQHPGIVSYVAHGKSPDGQRFLAMEWLDGCDLSDRLAKGPLAVRDCITLIEQAAAALAFAHRRGILHRDLKPTNLFLLGGEVGRVKLLDFGIARRLSGPSRMTHTGMVVGTPEYMAPEQARGSRELTPAADLFSMGCILYECLTGQPPFVAEHVAAVLVRILFDDPIPVEERRTGVPASLLLVLRDLLAKDPAQRIVDASELIHRLQQVEDAPHQVSAPTMLVTPSQVEHFGLDEQRLFSIVIATPGTQPGVQEVELGDTQLATSRELHALGFDALDRQALLDDLRGLSVTPQFLANGTLAVHVPLLDSAMDQVSVAARAALLVKERWPDALVSMATGRGVVRGRNAVGAVVEQAISALTQAAQTATPRQIPGVLLDRLSAKLLDGRFAQTPQPMGTLLLHEERAADEDRRLLGKPTPCVGREKELAILDAQLTGCIDESSVQVLLLTAEPGVGKSRLRHEFLRRLDKRTEPVTVMVGRAEMMSAGAPYGIVRAALLRLCGVSASDSAADQRARFSARISQNLREADKSQVVPFLGELCSVFFPTDGHPGLQAARQDPKIMRDVLRQAMRTFLRAECAAAPVVLVLDDLQWGDELSIALLEDAMRELAEQPLFVLAFARPEVIESFPKLWSGLSRQDIALPPLGKRACERLIQQVLGPGLAPEVMARAIEQSGGNALFLEELIRSIHEGSSGAEADTVVAMIQARLGRLDSALRRVIRTAAIFGQTFWQAGVAALLGPAVTAVELGDWLAALVAAELIQQRTVSRLPGQIEYGFRHSLVRDAAYGLLTESDLQAGHRLAATFLRAAGEPDASIVGEHFASGKEPQSAIAAFVQAAEHALGQGGLPAALRYVARGLSLGPSGESLGMLRSIESFACFWLSRLDRAFSAATEALATLRSGSGPYCRSLSIACGVAIHGVVPAMIKLPEMLPLILTIEPDAEGRMHLIEGLSDLAASLCAVSPYPQVQVLLGRLRALVEKEQAVDPLIGRWLSFGECHAIHHHEPDPWNALQVGLRGIALSEQASDHRTRQKLELLGRDLVLAELGDRGSVGRMRKLLAGELMKEEVVLGQLTRILLANLLVLYPEPALLAEAMQHTELAMTTGAEVPLIQGMGQSVLARRALHLGEDAEVHARSAVRLLGSFALWLPLAQAPLMYALIAKSQPAAALEVAAQGLALLGQLGCVGFLEVELRLAISESFYAAGDVQRAHVELQETLRQIALRAERITDPRWKASYLQRNLYSVRAAQLAERWQVR